MGVESPSFQPQSLKSYWGQLFQLDQIRSFSVCNGQFFGGKEAIELAFPVRAKSGIFTSGYAGLSEFPHQKLLLGIQNQTAEIVPFSEQINFQQGTFFDEDMPYEDMPYEDMIVGIRADGGTESITWYSKSPFQNRPRTFMGVADTNGNCRGTTVLILTSTGQTQAGAAQVLQNFGATAVMMLDGGGSTQLIVQGETLIPSMDGANGGDRNIPQAIGVISGFAMF
ncbi:MAG: phosphodiester glycosidase family protein [Oscillatoriales cyanobacterium SM2_3_0]|nr:phosphodiester glycosidase family protein [Oscillatoriales cyanobacterium SM2_3_0]